MSNTALSSSDADGEIEITNLPDSASINGAEIPVSEPDGADGKVGAVLDSDGKLAEVSGVDDGATIKPSSADIKTEDGAKVVTNGTGDYTINGDNLDVAGDPQVTVATNPNSGITGVSGVNTGAEISVPDGTPVSVVTDRDKNAEVEINGQEIAVSNDSDGIVVTPGEDGVAAVSGLDANAVLGGNGSIAAGDTVYALDGETSVKGAANGGVGIYTADEDALDKAAQDIINDLSAEGLSLDSTTGNAVLANAIEDAIADATAAGGDASVAAVTIGGADDTIWNGDMSVTVSSANDVDMDFSKNTGRKLVNLTGEGDNDLSFNNEGGNYAILSPSARGDKNITAGDGGDNLMNYSKRANVTMTGGSGADNIRMSGGANEVVDVSSGGEDTLDAPNGGSVRGYNPRTKAKFKNPYRTMSAFVGALKSLFGLRGYAEAADEERGYAEQLIEKGAAEDGSDLSFTDGGFNMGGGSVNLAGYDASEGTFVNMITGNGDEALMGWGELVNGSTYETSELLLGNGAQGSMSGSTMMGGTANDTVVAGSNDVVYVSSGSDDIEMVDSAGAVIAMGFSSVSGTTTLNSASYGHDEDNDVVIRVADRGALEVTFNSGNAIMSTGDANLVLNNSLSTNLRAYSQGTGENSTGVDILLQGGSDSTTYRARLISGGTTSIADQYEKPTEFYGSPKDLKDSKQANRSGVSYADYEEKLYVNMGDTVTAGNYHFFNIDSVTGGKGLTTLIGSDENNALIAGSGETTIWGAAGRDSLYGYSGTAEKGATTFVYGEGDGLDTIQGFDFGMSETSDKLSTNGQGISNWELENGKLKLQVGEDFNDQVIINNAQQQAIKMNLWGSDFDVEVGTNAYTYREGVDFYLTKESEATLNASGTSEDELAIYVNGFDGKAYDNVTAINASSAAGKNTLVGGANSEVITGGSGKNSLWGGEAGDDTLVGGSGSNEFFYMKGNGADVINNAKTNDVVNLFGISIDDIDFANSEIDSSSITVALKDDGGKLTVNTSNDVTFKVADGSEWHAVNRASNNAGWEQK